MKKQTLEEMWLEEEHEEKEQEKIKRACSGAYATPPCDCPYCGTSCEADWVDVAVGMVQCGPYHCLNCMASEIGPYDEERELTEEEKKCGWYKPHSPAGSSANTINGEIVGHKEALDYYRATYDYNKEDDD